MDQNKAILLLKAIKFSWYEPTEEFLFDEHPFEDLSLSFDEDFEKALVDMDKIGSPGYDEQIILNLLEVAAPVVPFNLIKQINGRKLTGFKNRKNGRPLEMKDLGHVISLPKDITEMLLFPLDGKPTDLVLPGDIDKKKED